LGKKWAGIEPESVPNQAGSSVSGPPGKRPLLSRPGGLTPKGDGQKEKITFGIIHLGDCPQMGPKYNDSILKHRHEKSVKRLIRQVDKNWAFIYLCERFQDVRKGQFLL
jgi:hypothetical protein